MFSKLLFIASLSVAATQSFASEATLFDDRAVSVKTRAEVKAEVLQARAQGMLDRSGEATLEHTMTASMRTRDSVRAEARADAARINRLYVGG